MLRLIFIQGRRKTKISSYAQISSLLFCTPMWKKAIVHTGIEFLDFYTFNLHFRINFIWF